MKELFASTLLIATENLHAETQSYFGSGFHEDAIQAGLAVGETLGGNMRPCSVQGESDRIVRTLQGA